MANARAALLLSCAGIASAATAPPPTAPIAPNETIVDAAPIDYPLPGPVKSYSLRWPYRVEVLLTVDRVGRAGTIGFVTPGAPSEVQKAVRAALGQWRFWPALGACRHLEQQARVALVFDEQKVELAGIGFEPVTARRALADPAFAWLYPRDARDRRERPQALPAGLVAPVPLKQVAPGYPAGASRAAQPGLAFVLFEVGADGKPGKVVAVDGWAPDARFAPLFTKEAVAALRQWRFRPAMLDGKPHRQLACQRFLFNMELGG